MRGVAQHTQAQFGVSCEIQASPDLRQTPGDAESVQLFRIAQEAVRNSVKHARAEHILIRLGKIKGLWQLAVQDDGVGLSEFCRESGGMGLRIMRYRAQLIHGNLEVGGDEGGGTCVTCTVPADDSNP